MIAGAGAITSMLYVERWRKKERGKGLCLSAESTLLRFLTQGPSFCLIFKSHKIH